MDRKELKRKARESLKGNFKEAIKLYIIYFLINFGIFLIIEFGIGIYARINNIQISKEIMVLIEGITSIISIIIDGLLAFSIISFYLKISTNEKVSYNELFRKNIC